MLLLSFVALLFFFAYRFSHFSSFSVGIVATLLSLCSGGMAWLHDDFFGELFKSQNPNVFAFLVSIGKNYVHHTKSFGSPYWFQTVTDILLPQRAALLGYPILLFAVDLLWVALNPIRFDPVGSMASSPVSTQSRGSFLRSSSKQDLPPLIPVSASFNASEDKKAASTEAKTRNYLLVAGIATSLLPYCQAHGFLAACFLSGGLYLSHLTPSLFRPCGRPLLQIPFVAYTLKWLWYFVPLAVIGFPQVWLLSERTKGANFLKLERPWPHDSAKTFWQLWYNAIGYFVPVAMLSALANTPAQFRFYVAHWVVFAAANLVKWQPWKLDNCKIHQIWHWGACASIAVSLHRLGRRPGHGSKVVVASLVLVLTLSGCLCLMRESHLHWRMFEPDDLKMADYLRDNTRHDAIFLTSDEHHHPVPCLTGRPVVMAYKGWLTSHGYEYWIDGRERDVKAMFTGAGNALELFRKYNVSYTVVSFNNDRNYGAKLDYFERNHPLVYKYRRFQVFNVTAP